MQKGSVHLVYLLLISAILGFFIVRETYKPVPTPQPSPKASSIPQATKESDQIQQAKLEKYLTVETALLNVSDNISLYFKDLDHGKEVSIESSRSWIPASTIKAFVVLEAFRQRNLGLVNFDQEISIKADNVVATELESDEFPRLREGTKATIRQLVESMIIQSDNTAYNSLLDILDRRNINLALKNIGITETVIGEKLNLDEAQFQQDLQVTGRQPNTTTVKDLATFFDLLYNKKIASADEILAIFKRQKINNMIPALLPQNTVVAHKTGNWAPIYHDGGVIFKPDDPFVLTVFTNSDDPSVIAKIAKVAYFQDAQSVGNTETLEKKPISENVTYSKIYLAQENSAILGEETTEKFPTITASDLGITTKDLNAPKQSQNIQEALLTPGSLLYKVKRFFENNLINTSDKPSVVKNYLNLAKSRLSEVKTLIGQGDLKNVDNLLKESEDNLEKATQLAKTDPDKETLLVQIKQANDLHYSVLAERGEHLKDNQKEQFIDSVYNFYQKNHKEVTPVINASVIANPIQQKPAVGTITEVSANKATIQFDDGSKKQVILTEDTKVRSFKETSYQNVSSIRKDDKVAIVGINNLQSQIVPQFILKNIPKELPQRHQGTIIEINPDLNTLRILNKKGQEEIIQVNPSTSIKSKDTNVSLEGIKAGSQVTIFGTTLNPSPNSSNAPVSPSAPNSYKASSPAPVIPSVSQPANPISPSSIKPQIGIQATSVTVTKNSSGAQEKVESKKEQPKKPEGAKGAESAKQPEPKKQDTKPTNQKK